MAIPKYIETNTDELSDIYITHGNIIYCTDTNMTFFDTKDLIRVQIDPVIRIPTDEIRRSIIAPSTDKLYVVLESSSIYRFSGIWNNVDDTLQIVDLTKNNDLKTPVTLQVRKNKVIPKTLTSLVYDEKGLNLDEIIFNYFKNVRTKITIGHVTAEEDNQRRFEIPFPFKDYLEYGNGFFCFIGMTFVDPIRYTVSGNTLVFNDIDDNVALGRTLVFVFTHSSISPDIEGSKSFMGGLIKDHSIPKEKLDPITQKILFSSTQELFMTFNADAVNPNSEYINGNTIYLKYPIALIDIHLEVLDIDKLYSEVIGNLPEECKPSVPVECALLATDDGIIDASIDLDGNIRLGKSIAPSNPSIINGTIMIYV